MWGWAGCLLGTLGSLTHREGWGRGDPDAQLQGREQLVGAGACPANTPPTPPTPPSEAPFSSDSDEILVQMCSTPRVCLMSTDSLTVPGKGGDSHDELLSREAWCWGRATSRPRACPQLGSGGITEGQGPSCGRDVLSAPLPPTPAAPVPGWPSAWTTVTSGPSSSWQLPQRQAPGCCCCHPLSPREP